MSCASQDAKPPKVSSNSRKGNNSTRQKRRVQFAPEALHSAKNPGQKNSSLGVIQPTHPVERSPYAPKYEDRAQVEALRQERGSRRDAWDLAKKVHKKLRNMESIPAFDLWSLKKLAKQRGEGVAKSGERRKRTIKDHDGPPQTSFSTEERNILAQ